MMIQLLLVICSQSIFRNISCLTELRAKFEARLHAISAKTRQRHAMSIRNGDLIFYLI